MEERRLLVAVALSLLVLAGYQMLFPPAPRPSPSPSPGVTSLSPPATPSAPASVAPTPAPRGARAGAPAPVPSPSAVPRISDERERRVEASGPDLVAAFSNRGARLLSWQLQAF